MSEGEAHFGEDAEKKSDGWRDLVRSSRRSRSRSVGRSICEVATSLNFPPFRAFDGAARTLALAVISFVIDPVLLNTIACQDLDSLLCFHKLTDACWCAGAPSSSVALSGPRTSPARPSDFEGAVTV